MTAEIEFKLPYSLRDGTFLTDIQSEFLGGFSSETDMPDSRGIEREFSGTRVAFRLPMDGRAALSGNSEQAIIDAVQNHLPGAKYVETREVER